MYGSQASERSFTYYKDDVCNLPIQGSMTEETWETFRKKYGSMLKQDTGEWLSMNNAALQQWRGKEEFKDECPVDKKQLKKIKKTEAFATMYFLEYLDILKKVEEEKVSTMLFHNCTDNNNSLAQFKQIKGVLCYLLVGTASRSNTNVGSFEMNLSTDIVQRSNITTTMERMMKYGSCIGKKSVKKCSRGLKLFKGCRGKKRGGGRRKGGKGGRRTDKH
ncbi:uncharacterized protein LOC124252936 [Haliotis rubra]|uniref:uncharacterized protein LOC124252936 n=1 Tax=Haliotis rubra TaxID=36100 RepID=UPI001EE530D6|nr:uncharacterized protein LOC124252936 [Haliotis rubra]